MRIAVLASPDSWYLRDLQRAAASRFLVRGLPFSRIAASLASGIEVFSGEQSLESFDAVLVRTMPPGSLEQVVFRMDALQQLESNGMTVLNSPKSIETAVDKFLTLCKLRAAGFDVPRTEVSQTADEAMIGFSRLGRDVVLKPLFGSEGRGITRINDEAVAERTFRLLAQLGAAIYQQEFISHEGSDLRLLVVGDEVLAMRRTNRLDWRTNVSRGATGQAVDVTSRLHGLANRAARAVGAAIAGVDLLEARDGRQLVIEVNAVPGWRAISKVLGIDVAEKVLNTVSAAACSTDRKCQS